MSDLRRAMRRNGTQSLLVCLNNDLYWETNSWAQGIVVEYQEAIRFA